MKTDRELLELAARAAGYIGKWEQLEAFAGRAAGLYFLLPNHSTFSPLTDDGDALRLAVRLNINVRKGFAYTPTGQLFNFRNHANMMEATRRAIVRAAAAIGEGMK